MRCLSFPLLCIVLVFSAVPSAVEGMDAQLLQKLGFNKSEPGSFKLPIIEKNVFSLVMDLEGAMQHLLKRHETDTKNKNYLAALKKAVQQIYLVLPLE
ncbi:hypothetical protein L596_030487 [Steinernema carpocapsae]|uniref:Uncharacterized protein n=1 Tax=Steinernema carpocapsae TaxID=34508 RepID=A0A4U5LPJ3_STECR|nr:hypothetical protein L596_030487 [Steinernema carpocapsae]